jgi:hypothetical protein
MLLALYHLFFSYNYLQKPKRESRDETKLTQTRPSNHSHSIPSHSNTPPRRTIQIAQHTPGIRDGRARKKRPKEPRQHQRLEVLTRRAPKAETHGHKHRTQHREPAPVDLRQRRPYQGPDAEAEEKQRGAQRRDLGPDVELGGDLRGAGAVCGRAPGRRHGGEAVEQSGCDFLLRGPVHRSVGVVCSLEVYDYIGCRLLVCEGMAEGRYDWTSADL